MLRPRISDDFPIMNSFLKSNITKEVPENIVFFVHEKVPFVRADFDLFINLLNTFFDHILDIFDVPTKMRDDYSGDLPHLTLLHDAHTFLAQLFSSSVDTLDNL